jgi:hypothetical protein
LTDLSAFQVQGHFMESSGTSWKSTGCRATTARSRWIERFKDCQQPRPRDDFVRAREEFLTAGDFHFIGKLGLRKTRLMGHAQKFGKQSTGRQ